MLSKLPTQPEFILKGPHTETQMEYYIYIYIYISIYIHIYIYIYQKSKTSITYMAALVREYSEIQNT